MMDPKLEMNVPPQVREFAQKSVDQAERAISSFMESASKSVAMAPGPMTDVAKQTLAITEARRRGNERRWPGSKIRGTETVPFEGAFRSAELIRFPVTKGAQ
jgi:hypothetical protein